MGVILWVYVSMQKPRLFLAYRESDQRPVVTWQALVRYLVTTTIALVVWLFALLMILTIAAEGRTAEEIAIAAAAVVGAARLLAHVSPEGSHELGKTIPLAVLTIILLGGSPDINSWAQLVADIDANLDVIDGYYWALLLFDFILTALWLAHQYAKWDTDQRGTFRFKIRAWFRQFAKPFRVVRNFGKPVKPHES